MSTENLFATRLVRYYEMCKPLESERSIDFSEFNSGTYILLLRLSKNVKVRVGGLGRLSFHSGHYLYTGSALRGLGARIKRHHRRKKKLHWHIDYITHLAECKIEAVAIVFGTERIECALNLELIRNISYIKIIKGFGASDCRNCCGGHLLYLSGAYNFMTVQSLVTRYNVHWYRFNNLK